MYTTSQSATVTARADDQFQMYVNGELIMQGVDWQDVVSKVVQLKAGDVVTVRAVDSGGPAAAFVDIAFADGSRLGSNGDWRVSTSAPSDWTSQGFNDSGWARATQYGPADTYPWTITRAGEPMLPTASPGRWIWTADNQGDNSVFLRFTVPAEAPQPPAGDTVSFADSFADGRVVDLAADHTLTTARVLPLGDSITVGVERNRPSGDLEGYRQDLMNLATAAGLVINFVGDFRDGPDGFEDQDHRGVSGIQAKQVAPLAGEIAGRTRPDVALVMLGTNEALRFADAASTVPASLSSIIQSLNAQAPGVTVLLAALPPLDPATYNALGFNLRGDGDKLALAVNDRLDEVVAQARAAGIDARLVPLPTLSTADLGDGIHPNAGGYAELAQAWFAALNGALSTVYGTYGGTPEALSSAVRNAIGSELADLLRGDEGANQLSGRGGSDRLEGRAGDDLLNGGAGDDQLDGGAGQDRAVYGGAASAFRFQKNADGSVTVTDAAGAEGADVLVNIEEVAFGGGSDVRLLTDLLPGGATASITARADDQFELFVNGGLLMSGKEWRDVVSATAALKPGDVVAVRAVDTWGPGGAFVDIRLADGTRLGTGADWKVTTSAPAGWAAQGFDDGAWARAADYGPVATYPWTITANGEPPLPADSAGRWIWTGDNQGDNLVYMRFTVPGAAPSNTPPVLAQALADQSAVQNAAFSFTVAAGAFMDADGDLLSFSAVRADGAALPAWLGFNPQTRAFTGTPGAADVAALDVLVTARDGRGGAASDVFRLAVADVNDAPVVATALADQRAAPNQAFSFLIPAQAFTDPDGDVLQFTAAAADGSALPAWLAFDAGTRSFRGTPGAADLAVAQVRVTASDGRGGTASDVFALEVAEATPGQAAITARADDQFELFVNGGLLMSGKEWRDVVSATATLKPGDVVAVRAVDTWGPGGAFVDIRLADGTKLGTSTDWRVATSAPDGWATQGFNDGAWARAADYGPVATYPWTITANGEPPLPTDSAGRWIWTGDNQGDNLVYMRFTVPGAAPSNTPPVLAQPLADQSAVQNGAFSFTIAASAFTDADGDVLRFTAALADGSALPAWLAFDGVTRTFRGTPGAADVAVAQVQVTASDGRGGTASDVFALEVAKAPEGQAAITARVDDQFELFVNGGLVMSANEWRDVVSATAALKPGDVVAVRAVDTWGPGGAFVDIRLADGTKLGTGADWRVATSAPEGWATQGFNDASWARAADYGPAATYPWTITASGEPPLPADSAGRWIWTADNQGDNLVYMRFTVPGALSAAFDLDSAPARFADGLDFVM